MSCTLSYSTTRETLPVGTCIALEYYGFYTSPTGKDFSGHTIANLNSCDPKKETWSKSIVRPEKHFPAGLVQKPYRMPAPKKVETFD